MCTIFNIYVVHHDFSVFRAASQNPCAAVCLFSVGETLRIIFKGPNFLSKVGLKIVWTLVFACRPPNQLETHPCAHSGAQGERGRRQISEGDGDWSTGGGGGLMDEFDPSQA